MTKYLLLKLAEEAGELVVAAIKHRLHGTHATRRALEGEVGDVLAIIQLLCEEGALRRSHLGKLAEAREVRERKRAKEH